MITYLKSLPRRLVMMPVVLVAAFWCCLFGTITFTKETK